jgi:hypothetical protein
VGTESCADVKKKNLTPPIVIAVSKKNLSVFPTSPSDGDFHKWQHMHKTSVD